MNNTIYQSILASLAYFAAISHLKMFNEQWYTKVFHRFSFISDILQHFLLCVEILNYRSIINKVIADFILFLQWFLKLQLQHEKLNLSLKKQPSQHMISFIIFNNASLICDEKNEFPRFINWIELC